MANILPQTNLHPRDPTRAIEPAVQEALNLVITDKVAKSIVRDLVDGKAFTGDSRDVRLEFDDFKIVVTMTITDKTSMFDDILKVTSNLSEPTPMIYRVLNERFFMILFKCLGGSARDLVKLYYETRDGRKALLQLYKEYRPVGRFTSTQLKLALAKIKINGKKDPRQNFKLIQNYGRHLNASYSYSEDQVMSDVFAALGSDYRPLVITLDVDNVTTQI